MYSFCRARVATLWRDGIPVLPHPSTPDPYPGGRVRNALHSDGLAVPYASLPDL